MQLGVFDEVPYHSTQQHWIPANHYWLSFDATVVVSRAFLGGERSQIHFLTNIQLLRRVEPTCKKYFVHELFELGDISLKLEFAFGSRLNELNTEPSIELVYRRAGRTL
jgi:hypothetical protein